MPSDTISVDQSTMLSSGSLDELISKCSSESQCLNTGPPFQQVQAARFVCSGKMDPDDPSIVIMKPSGLDEPGFYNALVTIT